MKHLRRIPAFFLIVFLLCVPAWSADGASSPSPRESADKAAQLALSYGNAVSLQYALADNGQATLWGGAGTYSRTEDRAFTDDILYGVGSVSKIYTTVAVLQLAEDGRVHLDAPVTEYIPDFKMADERYRLITVRMLLNHSSGLFGSSTGSAFLFADPDPLAKDQLLSRLSTERLKADPGAYSVYCNDGFTLAEILVERVTGMSFTDYIHREITSPLQLGDTLTPADSFDGGRLAKIYQGSDTRALPSETLGIIGTGGVYATAKDLARFGGCLCGVKSGLLSQSSLLAMASPECLRGMWPEESAGLAYGLGWDNVREDLFARNGIKALVKGGDTLYYHASLVVLPEYGLSAAVVSSGGVSTYNELVAVRILIDALAQKGVTVDETPFSVSPSQAAPVPDSELRYSGAYGSSALSVLANVDQSGVLTVSVPLMPQMAAQTFTYCADGYYHDAANTALLRFVTEKNGMTYLWEKTYVTLPGLGQVPFAGYVYQKLPQNTPDRATMDAWLSRNGKLYLAVSEKYTSQVYVQQFPASSLPLTDLVPGYVIADRMADGHTALGTVQIPGAAGRDLQDISVAEENGVEYLSCMGSVLMEAGGAETIYAGDISECTIQATGYARWYRTGAAAGKTMAVSLPESGAFYVYDQRGALVSSSYVWGDRSATLPENGWVVFAGDAGQHFGISMK